MATVLLYFLILIGSTFFVYISEKGKGALERKTFLFIAFLIIFLPSALRYGVGRDFYAYVDIFNNISSFPRLEVGFKFLIEVLNYLALSSQSLFIVTSFIFSYTLIRVLPNRQAWIFSFISIASLYFFSFSGIRQSTAIILDMLAITYFISNRYKTFFIISIIAFLMHASSLVFTLACVASLFPIKRFLQYYVLPIIFLSTLIIIFVSTNIIFPIIVFTLNTLGLNQYTYYFNSSFFGATELSSGLGLLSKVLFSAYFIFRSRDILKYNRKYWVFIVLSFLYAATTILSSQIIIFRRLTFTFVLILPFSAYILYNLPNQKQMNRSVVFALLFSLLVFYVKDSTNQQDASFDPRINPYQTIFDK